MGTILTRQHDNAAWTAILLVAFVIALAMVFHWLRADLLNNNRRCRDVLRWPSHRLMAGTSMIFAGAALREASLWPLKPFQVAREWGWWWWWAGKAEWASTIGAMIIVAGLTVMMWPALYRRFGWATLPVIAIGMAVVYVMALAITEMIVWWLK